MNSTASLHLALTVVQKSTVGINDAIGVFESEMLEDLQAVLQEFSSTIDTGNITDLYICIHTALCFCSLLLFWIKKAAQVESTLRSDAEALDACQSSLDSEVSALIAECKHAIAWGHEQSGILEERTAALKTTEATAQVRSFR